jgi:cytochrome c oxidase cbb3-type subunit III
MRKIIVLLSALSLGYPLLLAQDPDDRQTQPAMSPAATAGKLIFQQNCGFCHGQDGSGASGPDLIRSTILGHDVDGNLIGEVVHNGRPDRGMPSFQLPDIQVHQISEFLHAQWKLASTVASRVPNEYPLEKLLVGNAEAGKEYFQSAGKCAQCHSTTGDLAHIGSKYKPIELQSRIVFPSGANPVGTVTDATGHQFKGEQVYADEFLITLMLSDGTSRTWKRSNVKADLKDPLAAHVALLTQYTDKNIHDLFAYLETLK